MISIACWNTWKIELPEGLIRIALKYFTCRRLLTGLVFLFTLTYGKYAFGQLTAIPVDTIHVPDDHSPSRALLMSAVLPGAGQIYNKKYWKLPILYGGFTACGYFIYFNNSRYQKYHKALIKRVDGDSTTVDEFTGVYTDDNLIDLKNYYRRNRDLTIIITSAVYVLNLLDAYVDAHLFYFNVNDDLSMHILPEYRVDNQFKSFAGMQITLTLR